jgi:hypothetical protein
LSISALNKTAAPEAKVISLGFFNSAGEKFETGKDTKGVYYFGGYSASVISFLGQKIKTTYELMEDALNQEILSMVEI